MVLPFFNTSAQVYLTDVVVFSADSNGNYDGQPSDWYIWNTTPQPNSFSDIWVQDTSGSFLNGPTDTNVQPDIALAAGASSFTLYGSSGGAGWPYMGINLYFNNSTTPSISAFGPEQTNTTFSSFAADSGSSAPGPLDTSFPNGTYEPAAGTLSFVSGNQQITLTAFSMAYPTVYNQDLVGPYSIGADGTTDFVGQLAFSVTAVPEPALSLWALGALVGCVWVWRSRKSSLFNGLNKGADRC